MRSSRIAGADEATIPQREPAASGPRRALVSMVALAACSLLACGPDAREIRSRDPRPDVILISIDTVRADHMSSYGYARPTTPRLDALAEEGARVELAYAPSSTTGPTHASLFTGLPPIAHGVRKNGNVLDAELETLAELLAGRGYETGAVVSSYVLSRRFGYDQGFGVFDDDFSGANSPEGTTLWEGEAIEGHFYGTADDTTDRALDWLRDRKQPEKPAFLFIHYFDPHFPYVPPADFVPNFKATAKEALRIGRMIFVYDTLIAFTDQEIGRLLDEIEAQQLSRDPLVIVTADHGEGLMTHGHMYHGAQIYEEAVRVPLIVRWPGRVPAGRVLTSPIATIGLGPTILDLIGETADGSIGTGGFAPMLLGEPEPLPEAAAPIFLFRRHYDGVEEVSEGLTPVGEMYGVRVGSWKLIEGAEEGTLELFDLEQDPTEQVNRVADEPERTASLRALIADWRLRYEKSREVAPLSEEDRQRLRALGYVE